VGQRAVRTPSHSMSVLEHFQGLWRRGQGITSFGGQVALTVGANFGLAALALVTGSLAARLLGPQGRGELAAIQTWAAFVALLASLGLPDAVVYFTGRTPTKSATYLTSAVAAMLLSAVPFALAGYLLMPILLKAQSATVIATAQWYLVAFVFLMATVGMLLHPLRGRNDFVVWNLLRILAIATWLVVLIVVWLTDKATPTAVAAGYLVSLVVVGSITLYVLKRRVPGPYALKLDLWPPMLRYGLPSALSALPQMLNLRLDQMLMAAFLPASLLGYYAVAVAWSAAVSPMMQGIGAVLFPRVAIQGSTAEQVDTLGRGTRLGVLVAVVLSVLLLLVTPLGLRLIFGRAYVPAIPAALILVFAGGISGVNLILEEGLRGLGHTKVVLWGESIGLVATAIGLALLLRPLLINGAAIASLIGYGVTSIALVFWLHRLTGLRSSYFVRPGAEDVRIVWQRVRRTVNGLRQ
jgi:O-antigen/teichoic acid export membrane protein